MIQMKQTNQEARAAILGRVRQRLAAAAGLRREAAEASIHSGMVGPQPHMAGDLVERLLRKLEEMSCTTDRVAGPDEVPQAVARYLAANALGLSAVASPPLALLKWQDAGMSVAVRSAADADGVGVTDCFCAIAETGTLMLLSAADSPPTLSLLPETHVAVVSVERIVPTMEAAFARFSAQRSAMPPAVNFISGPSRTADIEQTIVLGAHGPCRVHVVVVG